MSAVFNPKDAGGPLEPAMIEQALHWVVTLQSGCASDEQRSACLAWRRADTRHEMAWQRFQGFGQDLRGSTATLPASTTRRLLREGHSRRTLLKGVAGLGVLFGSGWLTQRGAPQLFSDYHTGIGQRRTLRLSDGTQLQLDTASAVDVRFDAALRQITLLKGTVLVTSGKDLAQRPLIIATRNGTVTPIGTRFTVGYAPQGNELTQVAVLEGAVDIRPLDAGVPQRLNAGEQAAFSAVQVAPVSVLDPAASAWAEGMLIVERQRLADVLSTLDRYRPGILRCDPAVAELRVSGSFSLDRPEASLALLQATLPVQVRYRTRYWATVEPLQK